MTACWSGDLPSVNAAVADGASVNEKGTPLGWGTVLPLAAAAWLQHHDVVLWLLSHGADPNGDKVMYDGACNSTAAILQLLIDAGGDVNREWKGLAPLFPAVWPGSREDNMRVLLAQPSLDFTIEYRGETPEQYARNRSRPELADMMAHEVSGNGMNFKVFEERLLGTDGVCGVAVTDGQTARRATLVRPMF